MQRVSLGEAGNLIAEILRGDSLQSNRTWVCVRAVNSPKGAWMGSWSKVLDSDTGEEINRILQDLRQVAENGVVTGPRGPVLVEHFFFPGWQTWGPGIPAPLGNVDDLA
ncbi:hypothetical protein ACWDXT_21260 [Streptomyces sp. NPDC003236]